jgi:hypothetical protein
MPSVMITARPGFLAQAACARDPNPQRFLQVLAAVPFLRGNSAASAIV